MNHVLENPVYNALLSGDRQLSFGTDQVKYFNKEVSPYVGFDHRYKNGFADLYDLLPQGRKILYAIPSFIPTPTGWQLQHEIKGLQFVYEALHDQATDFSKVIPLTEEHIEQMAALAALTRPGPFGVRTIDFGSYFGIFENEQLISMTGQRLHVENYTEISAVCTHPEHTGKGYAFSLLQHQLQLILKEEQVPFLHVRDDNTRAIQLYERLGFKVSRPMTFYFMKRN